MSYFTKDYVDFFKELSANNNKPWFDANKKRYEQSVKKPFNDFIQEMINRVRQDDPAVDIAPKDAIFRINRDIRFSEDKSPYKTFMAAVVSAGGRKNHTIPGLYLQFGPEEAHIYGGAYMLDKDVLHKVRTKIASDLDGFDKLLNGADFKEKFGTIHGEQHKRLPAEFQAAAEKQPLLANKQFYYFAKFPLTVITKDDLPELVMSHYFAGKPMNAYLRKAMGM